MVGGSGKRRLSRNKRASNGSPGSKKNVSNTGSSKSKNSKTERLFVDILSFLLVNPQGSTSDRARQYEVYGRLQPDRLFLSVGILGAFSIILHHIGVLASDLGVDSFVLDWLSYEGYYTVYGAAFGCIGLGFVGLGISHQQRFCYVTALIRFALVFDLFLSNVLSLDMWPGRFMGGLVALIEVVSLLSLCWVTTPRILYAISSLCVLISYIAIGWVGLGPLIDGVLFIVLGFAYGAVFLANSSKE